MRRLFQRLTSSQEHSVSTSPDADQCSSNGASSPSPVGFGAGRSREEMAGTGAEFGCSAMAHFLPEFMFSVEFASDPNAWETQLEENWKRLDELLEQSAGRVERGTLDKVFELLSTICHLLVMEVNSQSEPSIGPILDQFFNEEILLRVQRWAMRVPLDVRPKCQMMLVRLYEYMLTSSQCPQSLLVHKPILTPLLQLLQWCRRSSVDEQRTLTTTTNAATHLQQQQQQQQRRQPMANGVDRSFVRLTNQICRKIAADDTLLHFFFHSSVTTPRDVGWEVEEGGSGKVDPIDQQQLIEAASEANGWGEEKKPFLVFDLLVPYLYAPEEVGQLARDALLLIISLSAQHQFVADYVAQESIFCSVLAAGLSGCFSQLPRCIFTELGFGDADEFHKLCIMDAKTMPELSDFHTALLFCNAVTSVAHMSIVRQIVRFFYDGFLLKVFKSSVLESDAQELCSRIVYLHLCLDTVRTAPLVRALIKLLVVADTDRPDGCNLLEVLLTKMNTNDRFGWQLQLCRVTLSLLRTLLSLHCEDLLWCAVFRHLMPYIPLTKAPRNSRHNSQSRRFDINVSLDAANFFLKSVPECTRRIAELYSEEQFEAYMREANEAIRDCALDCAGWRFKYDGVSPNIATLGTNNPSDELQTARQPFTRMCSARSSFASTGWNRYFQNRSAHGTLSAESNGGGATSAEAIHKLNELGKDDDNNNEEEEEDNTNINRLTMDAAGGGGGGNSSSQEEDFSDFNLYQSMTEGGARLDYFQFAYEGVSESDDPDSTACSRRNSQESGEEEARRANNGAPNSVSFVNSGGNTTTTPIPPVSAVSALVYSSSSEQPLLSAQQPATVSARSRMVDAIVATEWSKLNELGTQQESRERFIEMLNALPLVSDQEDDNGDEMVAPPPTTTGLSSPEPKRARTVEQSIALIESRWQYFQELQMERVADIGYEDRMNADNSFRLDLTELTAATATAENGQSDLQRQMDSAAAAKVMDDDNNNNNENTTKHGMKIYHAKNGILTTEDGFPMECVEGMGAGVLLDSLFEALSRLTEHSFATNLQLIGAFNELLAYSQPLLTTYLLYVDALKSRALGRITNLIADLKEQIDMFARNGSSASTTPQCSIGGDAAADFEQMVRRAVRYRQTRAERSERFQFHYHHPNQQQTGATAAPGGVATTPSKTASVWAAQQRSQHQQPRSTSSGSWVGGGGAATFRFTHRAMATTERGQLEDLERTRNFAYAAIAHSQICLMMAAFALQHTATVEYPRGSR